jgi:hypothetical protein
VARCAFPWVAGCRGAGRDGVWRAWGEGRFPGRPPASTDTALARGSKPTPAPLAWLLIDRGAGRADPRHALLAADRRPAGVDGAGTFARRGRLPSSEAAASV